MKYIKKILLYISISIFLFTIFFSLPFTENYLNAENINWNILKQKNENILKNRPENIMANFELIIALANLGEIKAAYNLMNNVGEKIDIKRFDSYLNPYLKKLYENNDDLLLLNYAAFYKLIKNKYREALNFFNTISKISPDNIWIKNFSAYCHIELENYEKAEKIIREAQAIQDSNFSHLLLGFICYNSGDYIKAVIEFSKSGELFSAFIAETK